MRPWLWAIGIVAAMAVAAGLALGFTLGGLGGGAPSEEEEPLPYAAVAGSVALALHDGQAPAVGIFEDKCDVYLVARGRDTSRRLPDGDYFFQVTDVSGEVLLSSDEVKFRQFRVAAGAIEGLSGEGSHAAGVDRLSSAATVQLCPFADSPDSTGMYQVWVTRVDDFQGNVEAVGSEATDFHGFLVTRSARALFAVGPLK